MDFPRTVDGITPEWLTQVLRESGAIADAKVTSFEASDIGAGQGVHGEVNRISLTYDRIDVVAPNSVVVKSSLEDDERRESVIERGFAKREASFYGELAQEAGMTTPAVYFSAFDEGTSHMNVVLEDLGRFRAVDQADDCSLEDATTALNGLVQMHAKWWDSKRLPEYSWLPIQADPSLIQTAVELYSERLEGCFEIMGEWLPDGFESLARKYQPVIADAMKRDSSGILTLIHGDFRTGNMMFDDTNHAGSRVLTFDWALASRAKAASDVSYFLCLNFGRKNRRQIEKTLLSNYHDQLVELGVRGYSHDEFVEDARSTLLRVISTVVIASGAGNFAGMLESEAGLKMIVNICERLETLIDWNCDEVIPK